MNTFQQLSEKLGQDRVQQDKNISPYLTLRTKTIAQYFFEAESREDWQNAVKATKELGIPLFVLGGGSNMAVLKDNIEGLVVRNMYRKKEVLSETEESAEVLVSSGYSIARFVLETADAGYEGLEYHLGLPGSVGGAIYMNSKWTKPHNYIGDNLQYAFLLDQEGNIKKVDHDYFQFRYGYSILQETKEIILEAVFKFKRNDPEILKQRAKESVAYRRETQPYGVSTAGCFFWNISEEEMKKHNLESRSAGFLIDKAGLKGTNIGGFVVSDKHANFIINTGEGNPHDLVKLLSLVKEKVKERFGVELREEVLVF